MPQNLNPTLPNSVHVIQTTLPESWLYKSYYEHVETQFACAICRLRRQNDFGDYAIDTQSPQGKLTLVLEHMGRIEHPAGFNIDMIVRVLNTRFDTQPEPRSVLGLLLPTTRLELVYHPQLRLGIVISYALPFEIPNHEQHSIETASRFYQSLQQAFEQ